MILPQPGTGVDVAVGVNVFVGVKVGVKVAVLLGSSVIVGDAPGVNVMKSPGVDVSVAVAAGVGVSDGAPGGDVLVAVGVNAELPHPVQPLAAPPGSSASCSIPRIVRELREVKSRSFTGTRLTMGT